MNGLPAPLGRRVLAYVIDGAAALVVTLIAAGVFGAISFATEGAFPLLAASVAAYTVALLWGIVYTWMQGGAGSIGMRMLGLELIHNDDNSLGFGRALGRNLVWAAGGCIVVGYFSPLFDRSPWHRGWHDLASGAVMTDVRSAPSSTYAPPSSAPAAMSIDTSEAAVAAVAPGYAPARPQMSAPLHTPAGPPPTDAVDDHTIIAQRPGAAAVAAPTPAPAAAPAPATAPARPTAVQPAAAPPASVAPAGGVISAVPGVTAAAAPAPVSTPVAPSEVPLDHSRLPQPRPYATLVWDDGVRHSLYGRSIFGRNPSPETGAHTVPIRDETMSLSKTHLEVGFDDGRVWVLDRHSTNGIVVRRGTQRQPATPGARTTLYAGDILEIGDRSVTVEVAR